MGLSPYHVGKLVKRTGQTQASILRDVVADPGFGIIAKNLSAHHVGKLFLVDRSGQTQASISVGEVGINLLDPDSFALDVLGDIMNGFGGRLFDELRSKEV